MTFDIDICHDGWPGHSPGQVWQSEFKTTVTVQTCTKARLTSVTIWIRIQICDPDRQQNLILCSLAHCQPSVKISCKSVWKFLRKVTNRRTNNDENITFLAEVKMLLKWSVQPQVRAFWYKWTRNWDCTMLKSIFQSRALDRKKLINTVNDRRQEQLQAAVITLFFIHVF